MVNLEDTTKWTTWDEILCIMDVYEIVSGNRKIVCDNRRIIVGSWQKVDFVGGWLRHKTANGRGIGLSWISDMTIYLPSHAVTFSGCMLLRSLILPQQWGGFCLLCSLPSAALSSASTPCTIIPIYVLLICLWFLPYVPFERRICELRDTSDTML